MTLLFSPTLFQTEWKAEDGTYLENLGEEAWANLFTEEVVNAGQAGHRAPQGSVWGRPDPVGRVDAVKRRLIQTSWPVLRVAEAALIVMVHGAGGPLQSRYLVLTKSSYTRVVLRHSHMVPLAIIVSEESGWGVIDDFIDRSN